jgi:NADH dehydrogenase
MKVALFGGTGFVGSYIIDELLAQKMTPRILVRKESQSKLYQEGGYEVIQGDLDNESAIRDTIKGCEVVIYNVGIIREFPSKGITFENLHFDGVKRCIDIAKDEQVRRFILMSANGVKKNGTGYQKTKLLADEYLKWSKLDYTIFRPSLVFGDPRGSGRPEFCTQLKKDMLDLPFPAPNFHTGLNLLNAGAFGLSPIHAKDVAAIFVSSINEKKTVNKVYNLGGEVYSWKEVIKIITSSYGKNKWIVPAPVFAIKFLASIFGRFAWFPITKDQLTMLVEGNICSSQDVFDMFSISPIPFNSESLSYLKN